MTGTTNIKLLSIGALAAVAVAMASSLTAAAPANPSPQAAIAARQANFKKMGAAMKGLNDQLKTDAPAKATMASAAQVIAAVARQQGQLFPAGSGASAGVKTDALPAIWSNRATFDGQMSKLVVETGKLAAVTSGGDVAAIRVQAKATGAVCSGCHRQFRLDT